MNIKRTKQIGMHRKSLGGALKRRIHPDRVVDIQVTN